MVAPPPGFSQASSHTEAVLRIPAGGRSWRPNAPPDRDGGELCLRGQQLVELSVQPFR